MTTPLKLRRCRFSLRTLFVVVTTVAISLGWQVHCIHERSAMQTWITSHGGSVIEINLSEAGYFESYCIPWYRRILGDRALGLIVMPELDDGDAITPHAERAIKLFPEAEVGWSG